MWRTTPLLVIVSALVALAACNDDGRTLAPAPDVSTSALTTSTTVADAVVAGVPFGLASPEVAEGELLDPTFTCDGINVPPELAIVGVPPNAAELAITMIDLDADGYVHWVLAGLAPTTTRIESGVSPPGAVSARTDSGVVGWDGPCPPEDDEAHRYQFTVYATAEPIGLAPGLEGRDAVEIIDAAAVERAQFTVRYARTG